MNRFGSVLARHALGVQIALIGVILACVALWPPSQGRMLLVPVTSGAASHMLARAVDSGAALLGNGPIPGSFVVSGNHLALAAALRGRAVLILAGPPALCGGAAA
jgi:hypothetical protein